MPTPHILRKLVCLGLRVKNDRKEDKETISGSKQVQKKNGESNIINSYFSFILAKIHSQQFLRKFVKSLKKNQAETQKIISLIYIILRLINFKRARRYINKAILFEYFTKKKIQEMFGSFEALSILTFDDISSLLRKCFFYYLNQASLISILTSKRLPINSKHIHLQKRRRMHDFINGWHERFN